MQRWGGVLGGVGSWVFDHAEVLGGVETGVE